MNDHISVRDVLPFALMVGASGFVIKRLLGAKNDYIRALKETPGYGVIATWVLNEKGRRERIADEDIFIPWKEIPESKETPDGVMLILEEGTFSWLPKKAFSNSDYLHLIKLAASKTKHSKIG